MNPKTAIERNAWQAYVQQNLDNAEFGCYSLL